MSELDTEGAARIVIAGDQDGVITVADGVKVGGAGNTYHVEQAVPEGPDEPWQPPLSVSARLLWLLFLVMACAGLGFMAAGMVAR